MSSTLPTAENPSATEVTGPIGLGRFLQVFTAVMLPMFLAALDQTLLATASPAISTEFGGLADTPWIALGYLIASASTIPLYGRLGDRLGYRRMLCSALLLFGLGTALGGFAPSMGWLVAARVVQGLGGGGLMVLSQALIGELVTPRERPRFQGWFAAVFTLASVTGPVLGGWVVHGPGWRWLFWGLLPPVALALWRVSRLPTPNKPAAQSQAFDTWGLIGFVLATTATLVWVTFAGRRFGLASPTGIGLVVFAALAWTLLLRHELRQSAAFLPLDVLAIPGLRAVAGTIVIFSGSMFALVFFLPVYVQLGHGATAADAGLSLLPLTLGMALGATLTGRIVTWTNKVGMLPRWGLMVSALGAVLLAVLPPGPLTRSLPIAMCGLGFGTVMPNAQIIVQTLAGRQRLGAASALLSLARALGATFGTAVFGALAFGQLVGGDEGATLTAPAQAALANAFHVGFFAIAAALLAGAWLARQMPQMSLDASALSNGKSLAADAG